MERPLFSSYKNAELVQYSDNTLTILKAGDPTGLNIETQVTRLDEHFQGLKKLFIIDQGNAITQEIKELDGRRDDALIGINSNVDSYEKHFDEASRRAGGLLRKLLDKYGRDLYKRSYPEETAGVRSLVNELESTPALTEAAATLHLTPWFTELKAANDLFDTKYLERNEAYADAPKEKFADLRAKTEAAFDEMQRHLSAHAVISPGPAYDKVISQLDQLTQTYNQMVKSRLKTGSPDEAAETIA